MNQKQILDDLTKKIGLPELVGRANDGKLFVPKYVSIYIQARPAPNSAPSVDFVPALCGIVSNGYNNKAHFGKVFLSEQVERPKDYPEILSWDKYKIEVYSHILNIMADTGLMKRDGKNFVLDLEHSIAGIYNAYFQVRVDSNDEKICYEFNSPIWQGVGRLHFYKDSEKTLQLYASIGSLQKENTE